MTEKTDDDYRRELTLEQYRITRQAGTERPFHNEYWDCKTPGAYRCRCCDAALFDAAAKFDSGTGWPSFTAPVDAAAVAERVDDSLGMTRAEVTCAACGAHLGHVFGDGPPPTRHRYCMNSAALRLQPDDA